MIELIAELVLEVLLQLVGEIATELGFRTLGEPFVSRERQNPLIAAIGYCLFGLILGGLSLLIFPQSFVSSESFHGISLLITPVLAGLAMSALGKLRERQGKTLLRLDSFVYGFIFAFPMAIIRFLYTT